MAWIHPKARGRADQSACVKSTFTSGVDFLEMFDEAHSETEDRFIAIGPIRRGLVLVVWTERDEETIRIISARWATRREAQLYRDHINQLP